MQAHSFCEPRVSAGLLPPPTLAPQPPPPGPECFHLLNQTPSETVGRLARLRRHLCVLAGDTQPHGHTPPRGVRLPRGAGPSSAGGGRCPARWCESTGAERSHSPGQAARLPIPARPLHPAAGPPAASCQIPLQAQAGGKNVSPAVWNRPGGGAGAEPFLRSGTPHSAPDLLPSA